MYYHNALLHFGALVAQWVKRWPTDLEDQVRALLKAKSSQPKTEFHCTQSFIINLPSSWNDWNTVEKDVKSQVIHPSTGAFCISLELLQYAMSYCP